MDAEIVFSGLCSFLNVSGENSTMGDPSVIAVQDTDAGHEHGRERVPGGNHHQPHIAFLAFKKSEVQVDDASDFVDLLPSCDRREGAGDRGQPPWTTDGRPVVPPRREEGRLLAGGAQRVES
jgi:hypothetical protein